MSCYPYSLSFFFPPVCSGSSLPVRNCPNKTTEKNPRPLPTYFNHQKYIYIYIYICIFDPIQIPSLKATFSFIIPPFLSMFIISLCHCVLSLAKLLANPTLIKCYPSGTRKSCAREVGRGNMQESKGSWPSLSMVPTHLRDNQLFF